MVFFLATTSVATTALPGEQTPDEQRLAGQPGMLCADAATRPDDSWGRRRPSSFGTTYNVHTQVLKGLADEIIMPHRTACLLGAVGHF